MKCISHVKYFRKFQKGVMANCYFTGSFDIEWLGLSISSKNLPGDPLAFLTGTCLTTTTSFSIANSTQNYLYVHIKHAHHFTQ